MLAESRVPDVANEKLAEKIKDELITNVLQTHNGQRLSPKEDRFITLYIQYGDATQAAQEAGYTVRPTIKNVDAQYVKRGRELLSRDYIRDEISYRLEQFRDAKIADTKEALIYLTNVMRGDEKDQFGLDISAADRMNAAKEIIKWNNEMEKAITGNNSGKEVHLVLRRE